MVWRRVGTVMCVAMGILFSSAKRCKQRFPRCGRHVHVPRMLKGTSLERAFLGRARSPPPRPAGRLRGAFAGSNGDANDSFFTIPSTTRCKGRANTCIELGPGFDQRDKRSWDVGRVEVEIVVVDVFLEGFGHCCKMGQVSGSKKMSSAGFHRQRAVPKPLWASRHGVL